MKYLLFKRGIAVGEAVVMSPTNVVYHLFDSIRQTRYGTESDLKKKYEFVKEES